MMAGYNAEYDNLNIWDAASVTACNTRYIHTDKPWIVAWML